MKRPNLILIKLKGSDRDYPCTFVDFVNDHIEYITDEARIHLEYCKFEDITYINVDGKVIYDSGE